MAKKPELHNGRDRLEEAIAMLIQSEAAFVGRLAQNDQRIAESDMRMAETEKRMAEADKRMAENDKRTAEADKRMAENEKLWAKAEARWTKAKRQSDERFTRIEKDMATIIQVLSEHSRLLERLPETIREKIGFKAQSDKSDG